MSEFHVILLPQVLSRVRQLRRDSTYPERCLWMCLRNRNLGGLKFRRQVAIGPFVVDYYCHDNRLVVELDGESHAERGEYDLRRQECLRKQDLHVFRISNDDVLRDLEAVLRGILLACGINPDSTTPLPSPSGRGPG